MAHLRQHRGIHQMAAPIEWGFSAERLGGEAVRRCQMSDLPQRSTRIEIHRLLLNVRGKNKHFLSRCERLHGIAKCPSLAPGKYCDVWLTGRFSSLVLRLCSFMLTLQKALGGSRDLPQANRTKPLWSSALIDSITYKRNVTRTDNFHAL